MPVSIERFLQRVHHLEHGLLAIGAEGEFHVALPVRTFMPSSLVSPMFRSPTSKSMRRPRTGTTCSVAFSMTST